eukprot:GHVR01050367.1.p1 GENE.GHVR01050367.1~~GHVR01050367.1.p1  ORF type:complete len:199 (+),score=12.55 GHVR01050367.1:332-928(+)
MTKKILPIISVSFGIIFLIQVGNLSLATADVKPDISDIETASVVDTHAPSSNELPSDAAAKTGVCLTGAVAETLISQRKELDERQLSIMKRETALEALETKVGENVANLEVTQKAIQVQIKRMEQVAQDDITHLVEMYQTMKPKKAAEIFESMAPAFAAGFLREMDSAQAGLIMSEMSARKSYEVSLIIANRGNNWRG